jgi:hypothetical protein
LKENVNGLAAGTAGPTLAAGTESAVGAPSARISATHAGQVGVAPGQDLGEAVAGADAACGGLV